MSIATIQAVDDKHQAEKPFNLVDVVFPDKTNHHGTLFGGAGLAMMDKFAFVLASRYLCRTVVTAAVTDTDFRAPVLVGNIAEVSGRIVHTGKRSVTIQTELIAENMLTGARTSSLSGRFVMVGHASDCAEDAVSSAYNPAPDIEAGTVRVVEIVFPGQTNHRGLLHGGFALEWLSKAALVAASRRARQSVVMAASEHLDFVAPAKVGDIVETTAKVVALGRTSLTIEAVMTSESPQVGERRECTRAKFVFVAIDEHSKPMPLLH